MSHFIRYLLVNEEPLRIADDARSQSGQAVSLDYIPGSAVRGYIVNRLAGRSDFESMKKALFSSDVRFGNAYPSIVDENGKRINLIPSPKGFYEDKRNEPGRKAIQNVVVNGSFDEGYKRSGLGGYSYFDDNAVRYYSVKKGSDLKILINVGNKKDRTIFRNDYIATGTEFVGDIAVPEELEDIIRNLLQDETIILGNARSSGYGKCTVEDCIKTDQPLYTEYEASRDAEKECYLYLISNTVMRDGNGQYCGLNCQELGSMLGVSNLEIKLCSTSTVSVRGYNRTYGVKIPSVEMYQAGSVFHLTFEGILKADRMHKLLEEGIGVRRNEGFGRVLISKGYAGLAFKEKAAAISSGQKAVVEPSLSMGNSEKDAAPEMHQEDADVSLIIARAWYRQKLEKAMLHYVTDPENALDSAGASNSQMGAVEAYTVGYRNDPEYAAERIRNYFSHAGEKEARKNVHEKKSTVSGFGKKVLQILDRNTDLETTLGKSMDPSLTKAERIMGIPKKAKSNSDRIQSGLMSEEDYTGMKLDLITMMIRYRNKSEISPKTGKEVS